MTLDPPPSREYLAAMPPPEKKKSHLLLYVGTLIVIALIICVAWYFLALTNQPPISWPPPRTVGFSALTGSGTLGNGPVAYPWALAVCLRYSPCNTYNFSMTPETGLTTNYFGVEILTQSGVTVLGWKAVLWSAGGGDIPLATFVPGNNSWTCLTSACPVGGSQDFGLLIIAPQGLTLTNSGDTLAAYGLGGTYVGGETIF